MAEAVAGSFKNSAREVRVGSCIFDVVAYDKREKLFSVIECKLGNHVTSIGHAFGQISAYCAVMSSLEQEFIDAYTDKIHLRWGRMMEATDGNRRLRVAFYVALTDAACEQFELIRSMKHLLPSVGIIRVKDDGRCRRYLKTDGERNYELAAALPTIVELPREAGHALKGLRWESPRMKIVLIGIMSCFVSSQASSQSVAEVARQNKPKGAQVTTKKVWTNDDFPSSDDTGAPSRVAERKERASSTLEKFRRLGKEELGAAVLKMANANVDFPDRRDWEQRLFEAKQAWLDQVDRAEGHKDSSKTSQTTENRLAQEAELNFKQIAGDGIQRASEVNDPTAQAHRKYQEWARTCIEYGPGTVNGRNLQQECFENLDKFKRQMQEEGTW